MARYTPAPIATGSGDSLHEFVADVVDTVGADAGGFYLRGGKRFLVVPPMLPSTPTAAETRAWSSFLCPPSSTDCGHAEAMVARANAAYAAQRDASDARATRRIGHEDVCARPQPKAGETPFAAWIRCHQSSPRSTSRYPALRYRAPTSGWLWLRGRRGHYHFADEIRAYDLATGAAYVAQRGDGLLAELKEPAAPKPGLHGAAGNLARDSVRELAFLLITQALPSSYQPEMRFLLVPDGVQAELGTLAPATAWPRESNSWSHSGQTEISFALIDAGKTRARGHFTWPDSYQPSVRYIDETLVQLEAGFERSCPSSTLPAPPSDRDFGVVSSIDADPGERGAVLLDLETTLERLRTTACQK